MRRPQQRCSQRTLRRPRSTWIVLGLACVLLLSVPLAIAQTSDGYDLSWWTADGTGGTLHGGGYLLQSTAGQPDAGLLEGGGYSLAGGFWAGSQAAEGPYLIYLPAVLRTGP
ncbi:MAG: hypothetical protein PVG56_05195 [Anaerolineae bacterium]